MHIYACAEVDFSVYVCQFMEEILYSSIKWLEDPALCCIPEIESQINQIITVHGDICITSGILHLKRNILCAYS